MEALNKDTGIEKTPEQILLEKEAADRLKAGEVNAGTENVIPPPAGEGDKAFGIAVDDVDPDRPEVKHFDVYDYKGNVVDKMTAEQIENANAVVETADKRYIAIMKEDSNDIVGFNRKRRFVFNVALPVITPAIVADTPEEAFQILSRLTIAPYISRANVALSSSD